MAKTLTGLSILQTSLDVSSTHIYACVTYAHSRSSGPHYEKTPFQVQLALVISTSLISNNRLSRSKNMGPVLT